MAEFKIQVSTSKPDLHDIAKGIIPPSIVIEFKGDMVLCKLFLEKVEAYVKERKWEVH